MTLTLVVGDKNKSSWSMRPDLALVHAGAAFDEVVVRLDQPDTAAQIAPHSAAGRVPILKDGALTVWDSLAIIEYVNEKFPAAGLWSADPAARAVARSVSAEMHSGFATLRACRRDPHRPRSATSTASSPRRRTVGGASAPAARSCSERSRPRTAFLAPIRFLHGVLEGSSRRRQAPREVAPSKGGGCEAASGRSCTWAVAARTSRRDRCPPQCVILALGGR
jgi:glutathione S-transferase